MTTLTKFLMTRIAEDEAAARDFEEDYARAKEGQYGTGGFEWAAPTWFGAKKIGFTPSRVLAQCAAMRAVVEMHGELYWFSGARGSEATGKCRMCAENEESDYDGAPLVDWPCPTLRALALPYADHPDYQPEWSLR